MWLPHLLTDSLPEADISSKFSVSYICQIRTELYETRNKLVHPHNHGQALGDNVAILWQNLLYTHIPDIELLEYLD